MLKLLSLILMLSFVVSPNLIAETAKKHAPTGSQHVASTSTLLTEVESAEGRKRFSRVAQDVSNNPNLIPLMNHFEGQSNRLFCGPTTAVIILNTLRLKNEDPRLPSTPFNFSEETKFPENFDPRFKRYATDTFFNAETDKVKLRSEVMGKTKGDASASDYGLQLRQLHGMLQAHELDSSISVVSESSSQDEVKAILKKTVGSPGVFAVVNYDRKVLDQKGAGHISPLGAYDRNTDSFLILDVNPNAGGWVWVKAADLFKAMQTKDTVENRGFLIVKEMKR